MHYVKGDGYHSVTKSEEIFYMHAVFRARWIFHFDEIKDLYLGFRLIRVLFIVLYYLQSYRLRSFVVHTFIDLPERPLAQQLQNLIPKMNLIALNPIIPPILLSQIRQSRSLPLTILPPIINLPIGNKFLFLIHFQIIRHLEQLHREYFRFDAILMRELLIFIVMDARAMVVVGAIGVLTHFCAFAFVELFEEFWVMEWVLRFFDYFVTFKIEDDAAFWYSFGFGEISRIEPSEFLNMLGRLTLRLTGETEG